MRHFLIAGLAFGLLGCEDAVNPGSLEVTWRTAGQSCADGAITRVRARLFDFEVAEPIAEGAVDCSTGRLSLADLAPGGYSLVLDGFQGDCLTHGARREDVEIRAGQIESIQNVPLDRRDRSLLVRWPFADGDTCDGHGVEQVELSVTVLGTELRRIPSLCRPGQLIVPGVPPGGLSLTVTAYDANGTAVMQGSAAFVESAFDAACGQAVEVEVPLVVCEGPSC